MMMMLALMSSLQFLLTKLVLNHCVLLPAFNTEYLSVHRFLAFCCAATHNGAAVQAVSLHQLGQAVDKPS
jgi:hypothetical protein